jgi:hypothetical protein
MLLTKALLVPPGYFTGATPPRWKFIKLGAGVGPAGTPPLAPLFFISGLNICMN